MTTAAPVTLVCPDCRHENEPERIYCHECGARLDRAAIATHQIATAEAPEQSHKRLQSMFNPRRGLAKLWILRGFKLLLAAAVAATLLLMFSPADIPPEKKQAILPAQISLDLENMIEGRGPLLLRYPEDEVNAFLANALRNRKKQLDHSVVEFHRVAIAFAPQTFGLTIERALFGFSLYSRALYSIEKKADKLVVTQKGAWLGQLPIHPSLFRYVGFLQADLVQTINRERRLLEGVGSIQLSDKEVVFAAPYKK